MRRPPTAEEKELRNQQDRERRRQKAKAEGRECKIGRPALDPDELARRKRVRRRAWEERPAGKARQARKNAKRKAKLIEGRELILRLELGIQ